MAHINERVQKYRDKLRAQGMRPITIWVPDTRAPGFAEECRRQSRLVAEADKQDPTLDSFLDAALMDIEGWTP
nr:antitoxin MazE family protein [uncultured Halomonas sp.]